MRKTFGIILLAAILVGLGTPAVVMAQAVPPPWGKAIRDSLEDANDHLQGLVLNSGIGGGLYNTNFKDVVINHVSSDSVWCTLGTHEVFTVTGNVEFWLVVYDSVSTDGADSIIIEVGDTSPAKLTEIAKVDWDAGEFVTFTPTIQTAYRMINPASRYTGRGVAGACDVMTGTAVFHGISLGEDIGYEVQTATMINTGISRWLIWWRPLSSGATVAAGVGGAL